MQIGGSFNQHIAPNSDAGVGGSLAEPYLVKVRRYKKGHFFREKPRSAAIGLGTSTPLDFGHNLKHPVDFPFFIEKVG